MLLDEAAIKLQAVGLTVYKEKKRLSGGIGPKHFSGKLQFLNLNYEFYLGFSKGKWQLSYEGNIPLGAIKDDVECAEFVVAHIMLSLETAVELFIILKQTGLYGSRLTPDINIKEQKTKIPLDEVLRRLQTVGLVAKQVLEPTGKGYIVGSFSETSSGEGQPANLVDSIYNFTLMEEKQIWRWEISYNEAIPSNATQEQIDRGDFKVIHSMPSLREAINLLLVLKKFGLWDPKNPG